MTPGDIARGLSKAQREAWIRTVLVINGTEPQRRAFIDGYNGQPMPRFFSERMHENYSLGLAVRAILKQENRDE
jgi:hypothetical protein